MVDEGEDWKPDPALVARVDADLERWQQGDVLRPGYTLHLANPAEPLSQETSEEGGDEPRGIVVDFDQVAIVTQTCDVVRSSAERPFVQVAPVVTLKGDVLNDAARLRKPRYAALPGIGDSAFADLDRCTTYEKTELEGAEQERGCPDDDSLRSFGRAVARHRSRFAFPDKADTAMKKLIQRMTRRSDKDSPEGRRVDELTEIRAAAHPSWTAPLYTVELTFLVSSSVLDQVDPEDEVSEQTVAFCGAGPSDDKVAAQLDRHDLSAADRSYLWMELARRWGALVAVEAPIIGVDASAESEATYSVARMKASAQLDLDNLSRS